MESGSIFSQIIDRTSKLYDCPDTKVIQPSGIEDYAKKVLGLLQSDEEDNRVKVLAVSGSPGAGKGGFIKELAYLIKISLNKKVKGEEDVMEFGDFDDYKNHYLYVTLDGFFREIGALRRTEMLRSMDNFLRMFSDDDKALAFIEKYLNTYKGFDFEQNVYLKRAEEREAGAALSVFRVMKREKESKSIILLDGLNSHQIADKLSDKRGEEALNVIKVMIFPRLERTFARLVKRDSINSNDEKSINDVISFRLKELFYVFNTFTLPSLRQDDMHIFDFSRETDQSLTKEHIQEIIFALEKSCEDLLKDGLGEEFDKYLYDIIEHMVLYFENMIKHNEYVTEDYEREVSQNRLDEKNRRSKEIKLHREKRKNKID